VPRAAGRETRAAAKSSDSGKPAAAGSQIQADHTGEQAEEGVTGHDDEAELLLGQAGLHQEVSKVTTRRGGSGGGVDHSATCGHCCRLVPVLVPPPWHPASSFTSPAASALQPASPVSLISHARGLEHCPVGRSLLTLLPLCPQLAGQRPRRRVAVDDGF
jgi:hypothetical protein